MKKGGQGTVRANKYAKGYKRGTEKNGVKEEFKE